MIEKRRQNEDFYESILEILIEKLTEKIPTRPYK